jgi:anti-anti-sigma factor
MITITQRTLAEIAILDLHGRLVGEAGNQFLATVSPQIVELGVRKILLNFGELTQCDSMGIGALLRIHQSLENMDGRMVICEVNDLISKVFALTHIDEVLYVVATEAAALEAFELPLLVPQGHG